VADAAPRSFGAVFRVREFQALWFAQVFSIAGDQLARVALTLLVYARTGSALLTAFTYALTFLPDLIGGPLLSGIADRYPRRAVMVTSDLARAVLVGVMAINGMPLVAVCVLLVLVQLLNSPFNAARAAVLPAMLDGDLFVGGQSIINITYQTGTLAGYVAGGALVAFTNPHVALAIDAATFVLSAALVRLGLLHRDAAAVRRTGQGGSDTFRALREGTSLMMRSRPLRGLVALACLSGFYVVGEGLAVPYAHQLHGGALTAGLLFAAMPAGTALGMLLLTRFLAPATRLRLIGPLAVVCCAVLVACFANLGLAGTVAVWVVSGFAGAYQTFAAAAFVIAVPDNLRGQAYGLASTGIRVAQGLGVVIGGAVTESLMPSLVVAIFASLGTILAVVAAFAWDRARRDITPGDNGGTERVAES
jgi:MFS family permease